MAEVNLNFDINGNLSSIGDSLANFIYSLALSNTLSKPVGKKLSNRVLARALKEAGLRDRAGTRHNYHTLGNFAEHMIFYGWARDKITIEECVKILEARLGDGSEETEVNAFAELLREIACRE
ncbi:MAG TPA: hypothetical protein ENH28_00440 [Euryarchaeota archaeon]|nr:hypothetical protein BMS3Bbin15_01057 [archaeon BMS3Bbin15]HDL14620.1 hypothetical protein [Euryarchaeota archaeon]